MDLLVLRQLMGHASPDTLRAPLTRDVGRRVGQSPNGGSPMSVAPQLAATPRAEDILGAYARFSATLGLSQDAVELRQRLARQFLAAHPDLNAWMASPIPGRLSDLRRIKAWPLISWLILSGRLQVDIDLLVGRHLGGMHRCVEALQPTEFAFVGDAAVRLGS